MVKESKVKPKQKTEEVVKKATSSQTKKKERKKYTVTFFHNWCKSCGICTALCVKEIIKNDETGTPYIDDMDNCSGCRFCEIHCPDFAITIKEQHPERRHTNGNG